MEFKRQKSNQCSDKDHNDAHSIGPPQSNNTSNNNSNFNSPNSKKRKQPGREQQYYDQDDDGGHIAQSSLHQSTQETFSILQPIKSYTQSEEQSTPIPSSNSTTTIPSIDSTCYPEITKRFIPFEELNSIHQARNYKLWGHSNIQSSRSYHMATAAVVSRIFNYKQSLTHCTNHLMRLCTIFQRRKICVPLIHSKFKSLRESGIITQKLIDIATNRLRLALNRKNLNENIINNYQQLLNLYNQNIGQDCDIRNGHAPRILGSFVGGPEEYTGVPAHYYHQFPILDRCVLGPEEYSLVINGRSVLYHNQLRYANNQLSILRRLVEDRQNTTTNQNTDEHIDTIIQQHYDDFHNAHVYLYLHRYFYEHPDQAYQLMDKLGMQYDCLSEIPPSPIYEQRIDINDIHQTVTDKLNEILQQRDKELSAQPNTIFRSHRFVYDNKNPPKEREVGEMLIYVQSLIMRTKYNLSQQFNGTSIATTIATYIQDDDDYDGENVPGHATTNDPNRYQNVKDQNFNTEFMKNDEEIKLYQEYIKKIDPKLTLHGLMYRFYCDSTSQPQFLVQVREYFKDDPYKAQQFEKFIHSHFKSYSERCTKIDEINRVTSTINHWLRSLKVPNYRSVMIPYINHHQSYSPWTINKVIAFHNRFGKWLRDEADDTTNQTNRGYGDYKFDILKFEVFQKNDTKQTLDKKYQLLKADLNKSANDESLKIDLDKNANDDKSPNDTTVNDEPLQIDSDKSSNDETLQTDLDNNNVDIEMKAIEDDEDEYDSGNNQQSYEVYHNMVDDIPPGTIEDDYVDVLDVKISKNFIKNDNLFSKLKQQTEQINQKLNLINTTQQNDALHQSILNQYEELLIPYKELLCQLLVHLYQNRGLADIIQVKAAVDEAKVAVRDLINSGKFKSITLNYQQGKKIRIIYLTVNYLSNTIYIGSANFTGEYTASRDFHVKRSINERNLCKVPNTNQKFNKSNLREDANMVLGKGAYYYGSSRDLIEFKKILPNVDEYLERITLCFGDDEDQILGFELALLRLLHADKVNFCHNRTTRG